MSILLRWIIFILLSVAVVIFMYAIMISLAEENEKRKNRKRGNLHLTVDKGWEKRFKNKK